MKNFVDDTYENIIWFPMGIYLITQFNTSKNLTGYTVSISGKDKMVLLNGEISGKIHANSTRFDIIEDLTYNKDGTIKDRIESKIPVREIIQQLVHEYGNEPLHNIIINDIDPYGLELLEYRGAKPIYCLINKTTGLFEAFTDSIGSMRMANSPDSDPVYAIQVQETEVGKGKNKKIEDKFKYDPMVTDAFGPITEPDVVVFGKTECTVGKIEYGNTAGYRLTEFIYPEELVANVGETITGVLDKIKKLLDDFEYFYDLQGRFVFQRKPIYTNRSWTPLRTDEERDEFGRLQYFAESMTDVSPISYQFQNSNLLTQLSHTPNYSNIKNDFSIWGKRKTISGAEIPIHLRYAIQKKPIKYVKISNNGGPEGAVYLAASEKGPTFSGNINNPTSCDWRELLYQMALDYRRCHQDSDYEYKLKLANPDLAPYGYTGYEQYYVDMEGFWRQLYDPKYLGNEKDDTYNSNGWNKAVEEAPDTLNFWIDFLDTDGEMGAYGVDAIGDRVQTVNNDKIRSIYFKDTPLVIFYDGESEDPIDTDRSKTGYEYVELGSMLDLFSLSSQGKSAKNELDNQLQNYTYAAESISITALPVFYLQPNTRIEIANDANMNVNGEYILNKITLPLTHNGTMSLNAIKDPLTLL